MPTEPSIQRSGWGSVLPLRGERRRTLLWLAALALLALLLRLPNLGGPDFEIDEILHVHAASSLLAGQGPTLPDGHEYRRALGYTYLVASSGRLLGLNESSARLPSVFFGAAVPLLLFLVGRRWYSARVGLVAALFAVIAPSQIVFSRMVRMYAPFQLLYLALIFVLFYLLEPGSRLFGRSPGPWRVWTDKLLVATLVLVCFLTTLHLQPLVIPAMLGPLAFLLFRWVQALAGRSTVRRDRLYRLLLLGLLIAGAGVLLERLGGLRYFIAISNYAPSWAATARGDDLFFLGALVERLSLPFLVLAAAGAALPRSGRVPAVYLICCAALPLLVHSHLLAWKAYRYIFHLLPVLYLLAAVGLDATVQGIVRYVKVQWPALSTDWRKLTNRLAMATLAGVVVWAGWPAEVVRYVGSTVSVADGVWHNSWRVAMGVVADEGSGGEPLLTTKPLLTAWYGGRRDLYMVNNRVSLNEEPHFGAGGGEVRTLEDLLDLLDQHTVAWLLCERWLFYDAMTIPGEIREYANRRGRRFFVRQAADMVIVRLEAEAASSEVLPTPEAGA